jgi:hypothetical protein
MSITAGPSTTGYSLSWSYDESVFAKSGDTFIVAGNATGTFTITATVTFTGSTQEGNVTQPFSSTLGMSQTVTVIRLVISLDTQLVNLTDLHGFTLRNPDGSFYRNDSFCDAWNATFEFSSARTDIRINVTSAAPPSLLVLKYSADPLGQGGRFCYAVRAGSAYEPYHVGLVARALNWERVSLALKESSQPFAVVQYGPKFTSYDYMLYRNSTVPSSLERPWVLFVRYDGNLPGYSYAGDNNTRPFNGSKTLQERAYFDNFTFTSLSYKPFSSSGVFMFHMINSSGALRYEWLNGNDSAPLEGAKRIEKYVFTALPSSLSPLLDQGYVYQNVTMIGCWQHEEACDLRQNYWLVPFLWNGRVNIVSVDSSGNQAPNTSLSLTIHNPTPLDGWLTANFGHVFGVDRQALAAFEEDLYPTNHTMTFGGQGKLSVLLNQTSLSPLQISITANGVSLSGNFTFVPTFVNSTIKSVPNSFNGTIFYANATIPLWSYNIAQGSLAYIPIMTTTDYPSSFLELLNSSGWVAGNATTPQTPSAFASQQYGFWPLGENLTVYVNLQGGGAETLGTQRLGPDEYKASFYIEPWSGGMSSVQLIEGETALPAQSVLTIGAYPSPIPTALTGLYSVMYPASGQDTKVVFTNVWGVTTTVDLGPLPTPTPFNLIPTATATAFGIATIMWLIASSALKNRKTGSHQ